MKMLLKLMILLNARSGVWPGFPSGFRGSLSWNISIKKPYTNHSKLMVSMAFRNSFQFMPFRISIPEMRKMKRSSGFKAKSRNVFSPAKTLAMYFPRGMDNKSVTTQQLCIHVGQFLINDNCSQAPHRFLLLLKFLRFDQHVQEINKNKNGNNQKCSIHNVIFFQRIQWP